ncbi:MAG: hypothetical protein OHK0019_32140 [Saprospiraceae bacterium]
MLAALGLLGGVLLSWPLWNEAARELFPALPVWGEAVAPPSNWERAQPFSGWDSWVKAVGLIILLISTLIFTKRKPFLVLLNIWLLGLCAFDLNRLQPWVWFYLLVFSVIVFGKKENEKAKVNALRWLLAGVYFWSGFNKLTPYFAEDNFAWFCEAFDFTKPFSRFPALGYAVAFFEMSFAAGLLWEKTRPYFRWLVIGFHIVIIFFLIKLDWNRVVIPWNLAMAGMVWVLNPSLEKRKDNDAPFTTPLPPSGGEGMGVGLTWLAPILCSFNLWPYTLSWQLYSNTQPEATFYRENNPVFATIEEEQIWGKYAFDDDSKLLLDDWATDELKVPAFAAKRTFYQMGKYLIKNCNDDKGVYILTVNRWDKSAEKMEKIPCSEFKK